MDNKQPIAIVGIGGIFPDAKDPVNFWDNILAGKDCSRKPPAGRWSLELDDVFDPSPSPDKVYSDRACFVDDFSLDTEGLNLDKDFIETLDPMFHLLLHAGKQAWHDCNTSNLDPARTGIIIGNIALPTETSSQLAEEILDEVFESGLPGINRRERNKTVNRLNRYVAGLPASILARALGLGGTSFTLDAACASSLYSLKYGVDELQSGRADAILCGGLSRPDSLYTQMGFSTLGAVSASGRCSPFDKKADGLVVGEGSGILVLKRLKDALRDKDHIYARIAGIGLSNDIQGNLMLPDSEGQLRAMREAYGDAGWSPTDVDLIECHGTGTPTGDRTEFNSMLSLWESADQSEQKCVIGSVKSNVGHLLTAAGSAGLIKTLLALKNKQLPPMANFEAAAAGIDLQDSPFRVLNQPAVWALRGNNVPRRAAVSAFGFGGINAHVLLEEYAPARSPVIANVKSKASEKKQYSDAVAVVGIDAHFGPWDNHQKFLARVMGGERQTDTPGKAENRWGVKSVSDIYGYTIDQVDIPLGRFRIPPRELQDMLPQQLLMLKVAAAALEDAGLTDIAVDNRNDTGVFIGIGLDLNTTNFHLRWSLLNKARSWTKQLGLELNDAELGSWINELRDGVGPPLSADRTMGALGGIVASRIARAFNIGGPSFTISSEESSGIHALELAVRALQNHELNLAIAGAVDLSGDIRSTEAQNYLKPYSISELNRPFDKNGTGTLVGEGAVSLILKRYEDAIENGDRIYSIITGMASSTGGKASDLVPTVESYKNSVLNACKDAGISSGAIDYIETHGSGEITEDKIEAAAINQLFSFSEQESQNIIRLASVKADIGHSGAAAGLASVARASLALYHRVLPGIRDYDADNSLMSENYRLAISDTPQFWLHDRADGPRRALAGSISTGGNSAHVILEQQPVELQTETHNYHVPLSGGCDDVLFSIYGQNHQELLASLTQFDRLLIDNSSKDLQHLAVDWYHANRDNTDSKLALSMLAKDLGELMQTLTQARHCLRSGKNENKERIFFTDQPLRDQGKLAFVFPGSGNHFYGMGQDIACRWPHIVQQLDVENNRLASQFAGSRFWQSDNNSRLNHEEVIFGQVWLGTFVSDVITSFGVKPQAIIGYSLGETAGLFATRTWTDRDLMWKRMEKSSLFKTDLAGRCETARQHWGLSNYVEVDWSVGVISCPAEKLIQALEPLPWVYHLITNTINESVIGGNRIAVESLVKDLNCSFHPIDTITTVHCELAEPVRDAYRELHLFETSPPDNVSFYSCIKGGSYDVTREAAADSIVGMAVQPFDFTRVINSAYEDGVRVFIEMGPGASCTRMIDSILMDKTHVSHAVCVKGKNGASTVLQTLALLNTHRYKLDLSSLYSLEQTEKPQFESTSVISVKTGHGPITIKLPVVRQPKRKPQPAVAKPRRIESAEVIPHPSVPVAAFSDVDVIEQMLKTESARALTHERFLSVSNGISQSLSQALALQMSLLESNGTNQGLQTTSNDVDLAYDRHDTTVILNRDACLEFATGSIEKVLGENFSGIDSYLTRVRLPDEPLMLVDRILEIEGEPCSMSKGRVVTEHDIHTDSWYLDGGRIPTCIAVESGQADLFLCGYLGIDHITKGRAVYRLLDAEITFHDELPSPGKSIHYDIRIEHFFKQGDTHLFRFNFDGSVDGKPLLSMENGCAGFFTQTELDAGKGIVLTELERQPQQGVVDRDWIELVPMTQESFNDDQVNALREGNLEGCFGPAFSELPLKSPVKLPSGRMTLVHRVLEINPGAGRFGLGMITGEADINKDDWFLTCHFVDDQVMPGTLMYECCLHTLRIYLMRMGWVSNNEELVYDPIPGVTSKLKCRGQVIADTSKVQYEITLKELGYKADGTPYAIADALMYADNRPIVQMTNMSTQLSGLNKDRLLQLWQVKETTNDDHKPAKQVLFDYDSILAFAVGKPSEAFGDRYLPFDHERTIARLPGPPYQFLDRIVSIENCEPWKLKPGAVIEAEYDVPPEAWYFSENRQSSMPFSVLLEVALQPCGWLAAYLGSALTSDTDLSFRNLGGSAVQLQTVTPDSETLITRVSMTRVSISGGMIIQNYDYEVFTKQGTVYKGDTYFGFFSKQALANQVGIRDASLYEPTAEEITRAKDFNFPNITPYPADQMRMIDNISFFDPAGGPEGLGFIRGTARVNPDAWFFKAHFYQDPVWPGSLGLESFIQLLKVMACEKWAQGDSPGAIEFESMALNQAHSWFYRGQIIPEDSEVSVEAVIKDVDNARKLLKADGFLSVDGRTIYQMKDFTLRIGGI